MSEWCNQSACDIKRDVNGLCMVMVKHIIGQDIKWKLIKIVENACLKMFYLYLNNSLPIVLNVVGGEWTS